MLMPWFEPKEVDVYFWLDRVGWTHLGASEYLETRIFENWLILINAEIGTTSYYPHFYFILDWS